MLFSPIGPHESSIMASAQDLDPIENHEDAVPGLKIPGTDLSLESSWE